MQSKFYPLTLLFVICLWGGSYYKTQAQCTSRYQDTIFSSIDSTSNVTYTTTAGGSTTELMDIYQPTGDTACLRHLVIWVHGGSFSSGTKNDGDVEFLSQRFAQRGYVCASINYRLAASLVELFDSTQIFTYIYYTFSDLKAAIRYFYKDAAQNNQWNIDTNAIFIGGSSAGGIGADFVATLDSVSELAAPFQTIANNNGGIDGNSGNAGYSEKFVGVASLAGAINDLSWIKPNTPPIVFCQGTLDSLVPYSCGEVFEDTLEAILHTYVPTMKLCGSGEMAPQMDSVGASYSLRPFVGSGHVPWDTNVVIENQMDSAVAAFFYSVNCAQSACPVTGIAAILSPQVNVFPNPAHNALHISITDANELSEIRLYDCTGRQVMQQYHGGKQTTLATDALAQGIYMLRIDLKGSNTEPVTRMIAVE